jgi:hypothetical protein
MSGGFKENVFSGSRFLFWGVVPLGSLLLLAMQFADERASFGWQFWVVDGVFVLFAVGLWNPTRFRWALRIICSLVFVSYVAYVLHDVAQERKNLFRSLAGLFLIGVPAGTYAALGSFSLRHREGFDEWFNRITNAKDAMPFREVFVKATAAGSEPDFDLSLRTLVAAEMLAATDGYEHEAMSPSAREWASRNPDVVSPDLARLATDAVDAAAVNPRLKQLWDEDDPEIFQRMLRELRRHLLQLAAK